jgi:hypothetical protein
LDSSETKNNIGFFERIAKSFKKKRLSGLSAASKASNFSGKLDFATFHV